MNRRHILRLLFAAPLAGRPLHASASAGGAALDFLLAAQSADGAWRSTTYGAFRSGHALSPLILRALSREPAASAASEKAAAWLIREQNEILRTFPVHNASFILESTARIGSLAALRENCLTRLRQLQSPVNGGWSYAPVPPPSDPDKPVAPMLQSNLSATALALDGLHAAGALERSILDPALQFVRSCQNHDSGDPDFDDGGFFQLASDTARNKAGKSGTDRHGQLRFRSYTAATTDGLRSLQHSRDPDDETRVTSARNWLSSPACDPCSPADLNYYTCRNLAALGIETKKVRAILDGTRLPSGQWKSPAGEMRENCPLVATSLAYGALQRSA